jgi:hypothetical protein
MMAFEGPFLAAIIARLPEAKFNLAAYGVSFAFAILIEAPVIMIMSASTALVEDRSSFRRLRNFTYMLNAGATVAMLVIIAPPVFDFIMQDLIGLPIEVAELVHTSLVILLPWPAAIGYRRFYQGILIRNGRTRLVAYGTAIRLVAMTTTAAVLFVSYSLPGAIVGAAALSAAVCVEAMASRFMVRASLRRIRATELKFGAPELGYRRIAHFYYPLALTSMIGLAVQPMLTFFMGRARFPVESLAVFPVIHALTFIFRALGLSYQEVAIALLGKNNERLDELSRFALGLGVSASAALALIAFTPLSSIWFESISGLTPELTSFAIVPTRILVALPALSVFLSFQRAILVQGHYTRPITWATVSEVVGIAVLFATLGTGLDMVGVTAASLSFIGGRLLSNLYLIPPCLRIVRTTRAALTTPELQSDPEAIESG